MKANILLAGLVASAVMLPAESAAPTQVPTAGRFVLAAGQMTLGQNAPAISAMIKMDSTTGESWHLVAVEGGRAAWLPIRTYAETEAKPSGSK